MADGKSKTELQAIEAAMKLLGISGDALAEGREFDARKAFEAKKGVIEACDEIGLLAAKVKTFGSPIRITIESNGDKAVEPTRKVSFPKSVGGGADGAARGTRCKVDGTEYDTMSAACDKYGLDHEGISARVVMERAKRNGKIKSFDLV